MMVNVASAVCILALTVCVVVGYKVGFLRMLVRLISTTAIVTISGFFSTYVGRYLLYNTQMDMRIYEELIKQHPLMTLIAKDLSEELVYGIAFLICIIALVIVVKVTRIVIKIVERIPVIRGLNKLLGIVPGAAIYFIVIWLVMYFAELCQMNEWGQWVMQQIQNSEFLYYLYERNLIKEFLLGIRLM